MKPLSQTIFLSDVHLDFARPDITAQFITYLESLKENTQRLYIVGDLFEAWIGDDAPGPLGEQIIQQLAALTDAGVEGFFTHGNRDFLIGEQFAERTGFTVLDEEVVIDCYGDKVLLMHGDSLCIDDVDYMALRRIVRDPKWQSQILSKSVEERLAYAEQMRAASNEQMSKKSAEIMDVNQTEVEHAFSRYNVKLLLHGHTHRPDVHKFMHEDEPVQRIVLGDWYQHGSVVQWDASGFELRTLPRA